MHNNHCHQAIAHLQFIIISIIIIIILKLRWAHHSDFAANRGNNIFI